MAQYQCISCGEIREAGSACSCPVCGYRMFEMPYDRAEQLRKEILQFLDRLRLTEIPESAFEYERTEDGKTATKAKDEKRFPSFQKIQNYVCSAKKTEQFCELLNESLEELKKYLNTPFAKEYSVHFRSIEKTLAAQDEVLKQAAAALQINCEIPDAELPEIVLNYAQTPNESLLPIADALLASLRSLSDKIKRFIKQNNIFGTAYQQKPKSPFRRPEESDKTYGMEQCKKTLEKVLAKRYVVDIFSDGTEELTEMLKALWGSMETIMAAPFFSESWLYRFSDGTVCDRNQVGAELSTRIRPRYAELDNAIYAYDFLTNKTETELFGLYNTLIELDATGLLGVNKDKLLKVGESEKQLNELIGLKAIKESVQKIKAYVLANKENKQLNVHMCFLGNPGTGKTEVARFIAGILYENKVLPTKKIIEVDRSGLVSQYFGATAEKTSGVIAQAMGGVLFIDEAYALANNTDHGATDYGKEAIDTLVKAMEDYRGKFCVIFAGYRNEMEKMLSSNPGLKSRIQFTLDFPNYSRDELRQITELMLEKRKYQIGEEAMAKILDVTDVKRKDPNFANARELRNILDQVIMAQNLRCLGSPDPLLGLVDVNKYIQDAQIRLPTVGNGRSQRIRTGDEELEQLIGLQTVKRMIRKIRAYAKRNKDAEDFNIHMCFLGNPGTGKTEVARILSRILYDAGVLKEAKLIETDAHGLMGEHVGQTTPKVKQIINDAMGGVLFVDEAYELSGAKTADGHTAGYGEEAVSVLLKQMEDCRGQFCVILAGYQKEMQSMLKMNPGFASRIQFTLEFSDYTREEFAQIAERFLSKKNYIIDDDALELVLDLLDDRRGWQDYSNARMLRNVLDQVIMNQNLRAEEDEADRRIILEDVEEYLLDERTETAVEKRHRIGF